MKPRYIILAAIVAVVLIAILYGCAAKTANFEPDNRSFRFITAGGDVYDISLIKDFGPYGTTVFFALVCVVYYFKGRRGIAALDRVIHAIHESGQHVGVDLRPISDLRKQIKKDGQLGNGKFDRTEKHIKARVNKMKQKAGKGKP